MQLNAAALNNDQCANWVTEGDGTSLVPCGSRGTETHAAVTDQGQMKVVLETEEGSQSPQLHKEGPSMEV